jgi:hypothetical protein
VKANPVNTISAIVSVEAARFDSARVRYLASGGPMQRTPGFSFESDSTIEFPVLGLDTASDYSFEVILTRAGHPDVIGDTLAFSSGSLPEWIPVIGAAGNDSTPGYVLLGLPDGAVIVDNAGKVVWYKTSPDSVLNSFHAHANGRYSLLGLVDVPRAFTVLDVLGNELFTIACVGFETRPHDILILEDGDYWALCDEDRIFDLSAFGGNPNATVSATVIQHVSATGDLLFEWKVLDHFEITDIPVEQLNADVVNFSHGNALDVTADGDVIFSSRSLNEITKVDTETGLVAWRFGGLRNQFQFVGDPKGSFQRQHGVRVAGPNEIQFLDNGDSPPSRLVRYSMDEQNLTATLIFAFADAPDLIAVVGGSSQYIPSNGHGLVSFGRAGRVVETDASGSRAWELTGIDGLYAFRAQRIPSLYFPGRTP